MDPSFSSFFLHLNLMFLVFWKMGTNTCFINYPLTDSLPLHNAGRVPQSWGPTWAVPCRMPGWGWSFPSCPDTGDECQSPGHEVLLFLQRAGLLHRLEAIIVISYIYFIFTELIIAFIKCSILCFELWFLLYIINYIQRHMTSAVVAQRYSDQ